MQKKILLIMIPLLLLTGCKDKNDELFHKQENVVKEELKNSNNITEETIREKYLFLKDNYESYKKSQKEELIYNAKFLQTIGNKKANDLTKLADLMLVYIKDNNKDNYEKLNIMFKNIESKENSLISDLYTSYLIENKVKSIITSKKEKVAADLKDSKLLTAKYLKDGINYIEKNISDPFKNNEVTENIIYYGLLLDGLGKKGNVKNLGNKVISYMRTLDSAKYKEITKLLSKMNKDKDINKALGK